MTKTLMSFIHAGGAGKTSLTRDIGAELARRGKRVLLIDLDPQANLSNWLGIHSVAIQDTIVPVLRDMAEFPEPQRAHGMDIIPSHLDLAEVEGMLPGLPNSEIRLKRAVTSIKQQDRYDFIWIDAPPSLSKLTANGANASDYLVIPLPTSPKGMGALGGVRKAITEYQYGNSLLEVLMYVPTQVSNTTISKEVYEAYQEVLADKLGPGRNLRPAVYNDASALGQPIDSGQKDAYVEIVAITDELLERMR